MTKSTQDANNTASENDQGQENIVEITVTIPDVITVEHWQAYQVGKAKYTKDNPSDMWIERYFGARELVERGFVHIKGYDAINNAIKRPDDQQKTVSMDVVSFVVINVALVVERGINFPTIWRVS